MRTKPLLCCLIELMQQQHNAPFLIVGLGNPGSQYEQTRHNAGAMALAEIVTRSTPMPVKLSPQKKTQALVAETRLSGCGDAKVILARPRSYMNLSGTATRALVDFYKVPLSNLIVLFDDLELDFGTVRLKQGGGDHGHKGLKSISQALGTKEYVRVGLGIGRPPGRMPVADFVLKPFTKQEKPELPIMCADAADDVERYITSAAH